MSNSSFKIIESRFHAIDRDKYIIIVIAEEYDLETLQARVYLDKDEIDVDIHIYESSELQAKYMYEDREITKEYYITTVLPARYFQYKNMKVEIYCDGFWKEIGNYSVKEIVETSNRQYHSIIDYKFEEGRGVLFGTCAMLQPIRIQVFGAEGEEIPACISWQPRAEVRSYYPEYGYLMYSDYIMSFDCNGNDCISIRVQSETIEVYETVPLSVKKKEYQYLQKAQQGFWGKTQYYGFRLVQGLFNYSFATWKNKIRNRWIEYRTETYSEIEQYSLWLQKRIPSEKKLLTQSQRVFEKHIRFGVSDTEQFLGQSYTNWSVGFEDCDYVVHIPKDMVLSPDALYECAQLINEKPDVGLIYADEDTQLSTQQHTNPVFKPDYNPDYLRSYNYIGDTCIIRKDLYEMIEMTANEGIYSFYLECMERQVAFGHIPRVLFYMQNGKEDNREVHHIHYNWEEQPLVSVLIPNKDHINELDTCIRSIEKKSIYRNYEILIIENNSEESETFEYYNRIENEFASVRVLYYDGIFNYSRINNFGVRHAKGEYILLLNNDTELIAPESIWELLSHAMRAEVGAVGARLYFPDDTIQHAGVIIGYGGVAGHAFWGFNRNATGYQKRIVCIQDCSAVTAACMMVSKEVYLAVGGLTEEYQVAFNDIDFCLKIREAGYLIVYNPYAEFYHYESKSRGCDDTMDKMVRYQQEVQLFTTRWNQILRKGDPYYNVNLTLEKKDFSIRN